MTIMLGMIYFMPSFCYTQKRDTATILNRIYNYRRNYSQSVNGLEQNVYLNYSFSTIKRNPTLFLVPTMYVIAKGDREYIGESYNKVRFRDTDDFEQLTQVKCGTIPRHRMAMPSIIQSITPNFYNETIYRESALSPFCRINRRYYKYTIKMDDGGGVAIVHFKPKTPNTQLVKGYAVVDYTTGRLQYVQFEGDFDMVKFKVTTVMDQKDLNTPLPERCTCETSFRFLGNYITAHCTAVYNCPTTLPDSIQDKADREMMAELRPIPLSSKEQHIYEKYDEERRQEAIQEADTTNTKKKKYKWIKEVGWDIIGDNLINGNGTTTKTRNGSLSMNFSPLLNPLYFGYSHSKGFSYKLKLGVQYNWNSHRYLSLEPQLGYSFKQKQFYYSIPLRMTYNPKRNGYAQILFANGNHISSALLSEDFKKAMGDSTGLTDYRDRYVRIINNVVAYDWLEIMAGFVYHRRTSLNPEKMKQAGLHDHYTSFATSLTLRFTPWHRGPTLTANLEHSIKNILNSNLDYNRWEFDMSYMHKLSEKQLLNFRAGTGFYTKRNSNYFVDFTNFRDENLPSGWEDDWSGQFQLLDTRWYNASNYYIRGHVSYDAPLLVLYKIPLLGRSIEAERIYLSALGIEKTRPYFELGYGFTNRFFSAAGFVNLLNTKIQTVGFKITVELFRRW